jgi:hypothetical protein
MTVSVEQRRVFAGGRLAAMSARDWWTRLDAVWLAALAYAVYWAANNGGFMYFNYHLHLAFSFLQGRLWIASPPSWLTEFAFYQDRPYVYFDPFPSVFLLPFAARWGLQVNLAQVSMAVGALNVALLRLLLGVLGVRRSTANWTTLLFAVGTVHFFAAMYGNTWLLAHLLAVAALTLAWLEATSQANPFLLGLLCAMAATSRSPALLGAPVLLFLVLERRRGAWLRTVFEFSLPLLVTAVLLGLYNFARFDDLLNNGYLMANQALLNPQHGSFSWRYIPQNIYQYFVRFPQLESVWPYLRLDDHGLSLLATTPAVLLLLRPGWSRHAPRAALRGWVAAAGCALILGLYLCYFWDGWQQFGSRYTLDFTPFLMVALALKNDERPGVWRWIFPALVVLSIAVNVWGVWWWQNMRG